ncbi:MAG: Do family serine endopeptidase [Acinetobacter sp.]|nr:Do family serine endopeptidase [Acinetobacter sp.]
MNKTLTMKASKMGLYATLMSMMSVSATANTVDFSSLVDQLSPAVVSVNAVIAEESNEQIQQIPDFFRQFFGEEFFQQQMPQREGESYGSGFFISQDGYLLTNHHVIDGASKVSITLNDRTVLDAKVIGSDKKTDIALLKVEGTRYPSLNIGNMAQVKVGEPVLAIGSPFGFDYSASAGIVSAKARSMSQEAGVPFIQTDVALNPGNSGGPLFNQRGEVIGVNSRIFSGTGGYMGLSFSVPIDVAMDVAQQLKTTGKVSRAYLGVSLQDIDRDLAESYQLSKPEGAMISQVEANSPAEKAGLKVGDVILKYNQQNIARTTDLLNYLYRASSGTVAQLEVLSQNKRKNVSVNLGAAPERNSTKRQSSRTSSSTSAKEQVLGMGIRDLSAYERQRLGVKQGIVITDLSYQGLASKAGLLPRDVITHFNEQEITSADEFIRLLKKHSSNKVVRITVVRQGESAIIPLRLQ